MDKSKLNLTMNTIAFTLCFACWVLNSILVTYIVDANAFPILDYQIGFLMGAPILVGAVSRLPLGILADKYGGRIVFTILMFVAAIPLFLLSYVNSFSGMLLASLGFGITGGSFAVGVAFVAVCFKKEHQGTALGIFGVGNAGAAITSLIAPMLLVYFTGNGNDVDGWRVLPKIYAGTLVLMGIVFYCFTTSKVEENKKQASLRDKLSLLKHVMVWRFGLYYAFVFGGFVALAQWLVPYYVNAYGMTLVTAGLLVTIFSFPSGVVRAVGGWLSDKYGARSVMTWVFGVSLVCCMILAVPPMTISTPGKGIMSKNSGAVTNINQNKITIGERNYILKNNIKTLNKDDIYFFPRFSLSQVPVVKLNQSINKKELIAKGETKILYQANVWIFTVLVVIMGVMMGIGKAAVYKFIPDHFPDDTGIVGGLVGMIGGLGGFFLPMLFGFLLNVTGIWSSCWVLLTFVLLVCSVWMYLVIRRMMLKKVPDLMRKMEGTVVRRYESDKHFGELIEIKE